MPGTPGPGWQGIRQYLGLPAPRVAAARNDIVLVQVDADVRHSDGLAPQLDAPSREDEELDPLCRHVKSWMKGAVAASVVIALPRESTEAWLVAVHGKAKSVEAIAAPIDRLASAGLVERDASGAAVENQARYAELAMPLPALVKNPKEMARRVPELARLTGKLEARGAAVTKARKSA